MSVIKKPWMAGPGGMLGDLASTVIPGDSISKNELDTNVLQTLTTATEVDIQSTEFFLAGSKNKKNNGNGTSKAAKASSTYIPARNGSGIDDSNSSQSGASNSDEIDELISPEIQQQLLDHDIQKIKTYFQTNRFEHPTKFTDDIIITKLNIQHEHHFWALKTYCELLFLKCGSLIKEKNKTQSDHDHELQQVVKELHSSSERNTHLIHENYMLTLRVTELELDLRQYTENQQNSEPPSSSPDGVSDGQPSSSSTVPGPSEGVPGVRGGITTDEQAHSEQALNNIMMILHGLEDHAAKYKPYYDYVKKTHGNNLKPISRPHTFISTEARIALIGSVNYLMWFIENSTT